MMNAFEILKTEWKQVEKDFMSSAPLRRIASGAFDARHYASYLRETYFYTREDPQHQASATAYFHGSQRKVVKSFLQHALSEVGHDQLALDDIKALGFSAEGIADEEPLPNTTALTAFAYYGMQYRSPLVYLGYLFFLEFLPTSRGGEIAAALDAVGIPREAQTFVLEHQAVDVHHNRLMEQYAASLLTCGRHVREVCHGMNVTARLYSQMIEAAFEAVDTGRFDLDQAGSERALAAV